MNFTSFAGLAIHLGEVIAGEKEVERKALDKAARLVKRHAKAKLGHYQDEIDPFIAWPELADSTKEDRLRKGFSENDPGYRTGEMRASIEHEVGDHMAVVGSNDDKLVWFELGTEKQPPRSVLGGAVMECKDELVRIIGDDVVSALIGQRVVGGGMMLIAPGGVAGQAFDEIDNE